MEKAVFPNDLHFKIAFTGCHNDCCKVRMHDFGIIGMTLPQYDPNRCISCGACVRQCQKKSVSALTLVNFRPQRDPVKCIGCGECVLACPDAAWTRSKEKYYRLTLLGRSGKKNPRMGVNFIKWVDEESIIKIVLNTYEYVKEYISPDAPGGKEHIGYIVDRTGVPEFLKWALPLLQRGCAFRRRKSESCVKRFPRCVFPTRNGRCQQSVSPRLANPAQTPPLLPV